MITYFVLIAAFLVLKKNYERLCHCLPHDYVTTVDKMKQLFPQQPANYLLELRKLPSVELINEAIICQLLYGIKAEDHVLMLCDDLDKLCDDENTKQRIEVLRNGL